jgi:hypothetical protein
MTAYEIAAELDAIGAGCEGWEDSPMAKAAASLRDLQYRLDEIKNITSNYESEYVRYIKLAASCGEQG